MPGRKSIDAEFAELIYITRLSELENNNADFRAFLKERETLPLYAVPNGTGQMYEFDVVLTEYVMDVSPDHRGRVVSELVADPSSRVAVRLMEYEKARSIWNDQITKNRGKGLAEYLINQMVAARGEPDRRREDESSKFFSTPPSLGRRDRGPRNRSTLGHLIAMAFFAIIVGLIVVLSSGAMGLLTVWLTLTCPTVWLPGLV